MKKIIILVFVLKAFLFADFEPCTTKNGSGNDYLIDGQVIEPIDLSKDLVTYYFEKKYVAGIASFSFWIDTHSCIDEVPYNDNYHHEITYKVIRDYECPSPKIIVNGTCQCPPTLNNMMEVLESSCTLVDSMFSPVEGSTTYYSLAQWNSCEEMCEYKEESCPLGQKIIDGICQEEDCKIPDFGGDSNVIKMGASTASACTLSNYPAPDGSIAYARTMQWNECDNSCYGDIVYCPVNEVTKNGVCSLSAPPDDDCNGVTTCTTTSIGLNGSSTCTMNCYCDGSSTAYFSKEVSCGDTGDTGGSTGGDTGDSTGGDTGGSTGVVGGGTGDSNSTSDDTSEDFGVPDTSFMDGFDDLLSQDSDLTDFVKSQFVNFQNNINSNLLEIKDKYEDAKFLFSNPRSFSTLSGSYNSNCFSFNIFGKHVVLDMSILGVVSPLIYFIFTVIFMILNFKFLLNQLLKGSE